MHWFTKADYSIVTAAVTRIWAVRVYANNPSPNSYGPCLGWCSILHWGTRKTSKCYYVWRGNADVPIKWQWQTGSHFRYLILQTEREAATLEPSGSCIPGFIGRKSPGGSRCRIAVHFPCHSRWKPFGRAVSLTRVCRWTEQSPIPTGGCFSLPTFLRCPGTALLQQLFSFSARCRAWAVQRNGMTWQRQGLGEWRDEPWGRWKPAPLAAAPCAPWLWDIRSYLGVKWRQRLVLGSAQGERHQRLPSNASSKL